MKPECKAESAWLWWRGEGNMRYRCSNGSNGSNGFPVYAKNMMNRAKRRHEKKIISALINET